MPVKTAVKILTRSSGAQTPSELFASFCTMAYSALAKRAALDAAQAEDLEARYMAEVARLKPEIVREAFPELLALCAIHARTGDFLGKLAGEIGVLSSAQGQFFTPYEVSRLMAEITLSDAPRIIRDKGFILMQEPASGAGAMILACAEALEAKGFDRRRHLVVEAIDVSHRAFQMCYVQLELAGIPARVLLGDSLSTAPPREVAYTTHYLQFPKPTPDPFAGVRKRTRSRA